MATKKIRMTVYLSPALAERIKAQATQLTISNTAVVQLAVEAGIKSIEMARDPKWQAFYEQQIREGKLNLPGAEDL